MKKIDSKMYDSTCFKKGQRVFDPISYNWGIVVGLKSFVKIKLDNGEIVHRDYDKVETNEIFRKS